ncbi:heat shock 70 kDa protein 12A-like [Saccostrea echinata]|uniref:heat shock 70 kDa protein 12A-like n=1 Tax=Saccostrea echinata TaxID=191078 RepID=UPI002A81F051|nr:heat shock 70 kDa protein 12A-like [Saccostrea echinata]
MARKAFEEKDFVELLKKINPSSTCELVGYRAVTVKSRIIEMGNCCFRNRQQLLESLGANRHDYDEIQERTRLDNYSVVAAIDFGTTYSGYAYAMNSTELKIQIPLWSGSDTMTNRAPTAVLFGPDRSFLKFGNEAIAYMQDNPNKEDLEKFYFFQDFKMLLYQTEDLSLQTNIPDSTGRKCLSAIVVFSSVIEFFSKDLISKMAYHFGAQSFKNSEIFWVLTVPAIWSLRAKYFMREAAAKAGIPVSQLSIALEAEAASVLCRKTDVFVSSNDGIGGLRKSLCSIPDNSTYLVVDMGGGTVDITLHQVLQGGGLRELYKASGGDYGGNQVNKRYLEFLEKLFGKDVLDMVKEKHPSSWVEILNNFERKKKATPNLDDKDKVVIGFPISFVEQYKTLKDHDFQERIKPLCYGEDVEIKKDKLYMKGKVFKSFFEVSLGKIKKCIETILEHGGSTDTILFVGGFAESPYLIHMLRTHFSKSKILVPEDPSLAVLKGAVWFGFYPTIIRSRICQYTYGFAKQRPFIDGKDNIEKRRKYGNRFYIDDVFDKHVEIGEMLEIGKFQKPKEYHPLKQDQVVIMLELYASTDKDPDYVCDPTCHLVGVMEIEVKPRNPGEDGTVSVRVNFSGTELEIEAREKRTGNITRATANFFG